MITEVGFSGTQRGMTEEQKKALRRILRGIEIVHHGDCIGADEECHGIATRRRIRVVHPPSDSRKRAWVKLAPDDQVREPKPFLDRNHDIVDDGGFLIAAPDSETPRQRSGTWATVRYADRVGVKIAIILPSGVIAQFVCGKVLPCLRSDLMHPGLTSVTHSR